MVRAIPKTAVERLRTNWITLSRNRGSDCRRARFHSCGWYLAVSIPRSFPSVRSFDKFRLCLHIGDSPILGYCHLARLRVLLGLAISALTFFTTQVCAGLIFGFQIIGRSLVVQETAYITGWVLLGVLLLWAHIKACNSAAVRDAQRLLPSCR